MDDPYLALPRTVEALQQGVAERLHLGAQVYVSLEGDPVASFGVGEARPGVPMTADTLLGWLSSGKPLAAVAIARLWEQGRLDIDDRIASFIPEFAARGKGRITLRQVLTHTTGLPLIDGRGPSLTWAGIIARICAVELKPDWTPGKKAGYDGASGWFLLGEIVRRLDGRPYEDFVRSEILEPLALRDSWIALPPERHQAYGDRIGLFYAMEGGALEPHPYWNLEEAWTFPRPGASAHGPARELGRFYEMLLFRGELDRVRILSPQAVEALTAHHRVGMFDETLRHVVDYGLGFVLDSNQYGANTVPYGYSPFCSPRTFGHSGSQSSTGFADPERGLAVVVLTNGTPGERRHQRRMRAIISAIYEDLGFTGR